MWKVFSPGFNFECSHFVAIQIFILYQNVLILKFMASKLINFDMRSGNKSQISHQIDPTPFTE